MSRNCIPEQSSKLYLKYNDIKMKQALDEYFTSPNKLLSAIADKYNVNKLALYRHSRRLKMQRRHKVIDKETEAHIIKYLNICAKWGYPIDTYELRNIVKLYLDRMGITQKHLKDNMPGLDYASNFLKRHKDVLSTKICENTGKSTHLSAVVINEYFCELAATMTDVQARNIINYNEISFSDDPDSKKVIKKRKAKYNEGSNENKSAISIILTGTAIGQLLPPYIIYNANHIYDTWKINGPNGAYYNRTASGWIDGCMFEDYIKTIIIPYCKDNPGKKLLIGDNLSSHLSVEVIRICYENNISFTFVPENSNYLTQPLDIAFFRPLKAAWRKILMKWKKNDGKSLATVPKARFPKLLNEIFNILSDNIESNIKLGFRRAGIVPIDSSQVLTRLPEGCTEDLESRHVFESSTSGILKEISNNTMEV